MRGRKNHFEIYFQRYQELVAAIHSTQAISLVAGESLRDFPSRLPKKSREAIADFFSFLSSEIEQAAAGKKRDASAAKAQKKMPANRTRLVTAAFRVLLARFLLPKKPAAGAGSGRLGINFANQLRAQEVVMQLAHLDAFMADSVRAVCRAEPRLLIRSKTMTWEDIVGCESWEGVTTHMIETSAYTYGWNSIRKKTELLSSEFGVVVKASDKDIQALEDAEQLRHIVVHNGGRISKEFNKRTRSNARIGAPAPIPQQLVDRLSLATLNVAGQILEGMQTSTSVNQGVR